MAETETLRSEPVSPRPLPPRKRASSQNAGIKFQRLMLEALIAKRLSGIVKTHLENAVTKQLDELVKIKLRDLMFSSEFMQHLIKVMCTFNFAMLSAFRASPDKSNPPVSPPLYQLRFRTENFDKIYSTKNLVGESGIPIEVELVDESGNVVRDGKEASASLVLLVLDVNLSENVTTLAEFRKAEQMPWDKETPLLKGSTNVKLDNGIGTLDPDLCFTDNSSWTSKKQFCLGLVPDSEELRIQGAKTRPFKVLTQRSEGNQKHNIPESTDEVWRLNSIRNGGIYHKKLKEIKVYTVGDLLNCLQSKPDEIKKIFRRVHDFNAVVLHARKCKRVERDESVVNGTCHTGVCSYSNGQCFIREEEPIPQGSINQSIPSVDELRSDLVGSSSILLDPSRTTCLAGPDFADTNIPTSEYSNMDGQGRSVMHSEFDTVRGQELQTEDERNQYGHNGFGMLDGSGRNTSSIMPSATYSQGLLGTEEPAYVLAVTSPSTSLKRRWDQNHDPVYRGMRPRLATCQSPSNQVESAQELPCHELFMIGTQLDWTKYSCLSPDDSNTLVNPNLTPMPTESPIRAFSGYASPNMTHP